MEDVVAQLPNPQTDWYPIGDQFLVPAVSTALTIPAVPAGFTKQGNAFVAIIQAQAQGMWITRGGAAVTAAVTGGLLLNPGDWMIVPGLNNIKGIRAIQNAAGGSLACSYYVFRPGAGSAV